MIEVLSKILPIIMMVAIGKALHKTQFLTPETIREVKDLIMQIAMPAVLFRAFIWMDLELSQLSISFSMIILLLILFITGFIIRKILGGKDSFLPYTMSGMSFGLLSIPLFIAVFGIENLSYISLFGVGHELFMWIILYNTMKLDYSSEKLGMKDLVIILKSKVMWAVIGGVVLNLLGASYWINTYPILGTIDTTLAYLASLATPMILIVIGYTIRINHSFVKKAWYYVSVRYVVIAIIGYAYKILVLDTFFTTSPLFYHAYVTLLVTTPGFSLPLFAEKYAGEEYGEISNNVVVISLFVCLFLFTSYLMIVGI